MQFTYSSYNLKNTFFSRIPLLVCLLMSRCLAKEMTVLLFLRSMASTSTMKAAHRNMLPSANKTRQKMVIDIEIALHIG